VLVVEDDDAIRDAIVEVLLDEGYAVSMAADGRAALTRLREELSDVVLLDLMMPGMNGWQFRRAQSADPEIAHIPVIVVSALGERTEVDAAAFVPKPCCVSDLLQAVEQHILRP
jgi:CheY-like chemotaxis protein